MRAVNLQNFLGVLPRRNVLIYSDESKLSDRNSVSEFLVFQFGLRMCSGAFLIGKYKDSYDAEAYGALQRLHVAITLPSTQFSNDALVFLDNSDVATKLPTITSKTSESILLGFAKETKK